MATKRYIRPSTSGWDVLREGDRRGVTRAATKREAIDAARKILRKAGGGEIKVMNSYGKVTEADTVPPPRSRRRGSSQQA